MIIPKLKSCDRESFVIERSRDKSVLHIGCADWPFTAEKLRDGSLLHSKIAAVAKKATGVDLSGEGVRLLQDAGVPDIVHLNAEQTLHDALGTTFDVVVAGEVIEHVLNPGQFLASIRTVCRPDTEVLITTVNYARIKQLPFLLARNERVHPDHVYYFSCSTLETLLRQCGFTVTEWYSYWWAGKRVFRYFDAVASRVPFLQPYADNLCVVTKLQA